MVSLVSEMWLSVEHSAWPLREGEAMIIDGSCPYSLVMHCPWCEEAIDPVMESHDEFATAWRCPKCGHRWEEW